MGCEMLETAQLWRAIEVYLKHAYPDRSVPGAVQQRLDLLRAAGESPWGSPAMEKSGAGGERCALRLGNPGYPQMKRAIEPAPAGDTYLLRVDTHDRHVRPAPTSADYPAFCALQDRHQK